METNFKVGQKVWDAVIAPGIDGVVKRIIEDVIFVMFDDQQRTYMPGGRYYSEWSPTLSAIPYEFKLPDQPDQPEHFEFDELVLVRDMGHQEWCVRRFRKFNECSAMPYGTNAGDWIKIRKFDAELAYRK